MLPQIFRPSDSPAILGDYDFVSCVVENISFVDNMSGFLYSIILIFHRLLLAWLLLLVQQINATPVFVKLLNGLVVVIFVKNNNLK